MESPKMLVEVLTYYGRFADEYMAGTQYMWHGFIDH